MTDTAPSISFQVVERPKAPATRGAEPNPFLDTVKDFAENGKPEAAVSFTLQGIAPETKGKTATGNDKKVLDPKLAKVLRQLRLAGAKLSPPVTVRSTVKYSGTGTKADPHAATVTFWTAPKVVVNRDADTAPNPNPPTDDNAA